MKAAIVYNITQRYFLTDRLSFLTHAKKRWRPVVGVAMTHSFSFRSRNDGGEFQ